MPPVFTPDKPSNNPVSHAPFQAAPCMRALSLAPKPAIIKPNRDDPVFQSRYHLLPRAHPSSSNCWQAGIQPLYAATLSQLLQQEEQANIVIDPASGQALKYRHLICGPNGATWIKALANNLGRLAQGIVTCMPTGTNTVFFVTK